MPDRQLGAVDRLVAHMLIPPVVVWLPSSCPPACSRTPATALGYDIPAALEETDDH
jgi:hypothetical protein